MTISTIEGFEKEKSGTNPDKLRWDYKFREVKIDLKYSGGHRAGFYCIAERQSY